MARIPRDAPRVVIDRDEGQVTIIGTLVWRNFSDGLGLARGRSTYEIEMPIAGTPFANGFDALPAGGTRELRGRGRIELDDPKFANGRDVGRNLDFGAYAADEPIDALPRRGIVLRDFTGPYNVGRLDGDQTYQFSIGFDGDFSAITTLVAFMRVRQPVLGTDEFTEELYRGVDGISGKLELSALPGGPRAGGGGGGGGGGGQRGTPRDDRILGDGGRDSIAGRGGDDTLVGRGGADRLDGNGGADRLAGGGGADRLRGNAGRDRLDGGAGKDTLLGGAGRDRLEDGEGRDVLAGGAGADTFRLTRDRDRDRIRDWDDGRDRINLVDFGRRADFEDLDISRNGDGVRIRLRGEALDVSPDQGRLRPRDLDEGDFVFA